MTKAFAPTYSAALLDNGYDLISGDVKISLMTASYVYSSAHDFHADLTNILTTSANLGSKTNTAGMFDFADLSLGSPAGPGTGTQCWVWLDTGVSGTSPLVYYFNEDATAAAISIAADGTAINFVVPAGGLFRV
jgi:hypothetical protein